MPKVKLLMVGFEDYTGDIGVYSFVNGVSEDMSIPDAERVASAMPCRLVVDDVVTDINPSVTQKLVDIKDSVMPVVEASVEPQVAPTAAPEPQAPLSYDFTKESLEKLADAGGIPALREIANLYDVRGTSIVGLINDLVAKKVAVEAAQA